MTVQQILAARFSPNLQELPAPIYVESRMTPRLGLAVESMKRHMTDEGWQLFAGLEGAGYDLVGHALPYSLTNVPSILETFNPGVVVLQDKREWEGLTADRSRDPRMAFSSVEVLEARRDIFKLTVLKDAQSSPGYHQQSAAEIGCHAWIVYYHPKIVKHLAPYVRERHLIRTWHTVDKDIVPTYSSHAGNREKQQRANCVVSGAVSGAYPLRSRIVRDCEAGKFKDCAVLKHPGYHRNGCATPAFLQTLSHFKVAICTASIYGYALRKIIEATACGCRVITDLPEDDKLPLIDANLTRVESAASTDMIRALANRLADEYDVETQARHARAACQWYDYHFQGALLAARIEDMRSNYNAAV